MTVNLRCSSWKQLENMYERDLKRSGFFMRSAKPPPVGTAIRITLTLPTNTTLHLSGEVHQHIGPGELDGRGPGLDVKLQQVSQSTLWLIETALESARKKGALGAKDAEAPVRSKAASQGAPLESDEQHSESEGELVDALSEELASLQRFNPFQVLGVGYGASDQDVRSAFGKLSKRYHPDRFARYRSREAKELANEIFIHIRDAYRRLIDASSRERVKKDIKARKQGGSGLNQIAVAANGVRTALRESTQQKKRVRAPSRPGTAPGRPAPPPIPSAKKLEGTPTPALKPRAASPAKPRAGTINGTPPAGHSGAKIADAEIRLEQQDFDGALRAYEAAVEANPQDVIARAGLELVHGFRALANGDRLDAAERFETALDIDPSNAKAAYQLAEMRRQATSERRGALAKLLQKMG